MRVVRRVTVAFLAVALLVLAGCSGSGGDDKPTAAPKPFLLVATLGKKVTPKQKKAVEQEMRRTHGARDVKYLNRQQAYAELVRRLKKNPTLLGSVRPEAVPAVVRCTVPVRADATAAEPKLRKLKGVTSVLIQQVGTTPTAVPTPAPS